MDKNRFDGFTRQLAKRENRRQALKTLFAGGAGTAAALMIGKETDAAKPGGSTACCPADHPALCGLTCTAVATDPQNCGSCGNTCSSGQTCVNGACSPAATRCKKTRDCPSGQTCTNGVCTPLTPFCTSPGDCPPTGNDCITPTCTNNACGTLNVASGGACGSGGVCDGSGHCLQCLDPTDCPGTDTECATRTCTNGTCGMSNVASGTPLVAQTPRDCQQQVCNGAGGIESVPDNNDTPAYVSECVQSVCTSGVPSNPTAPAGTACSINGVVCDGAGNCVECVTPANCLGGVANATTTCKNGLCGYTCNAPFGDCNPGPDGCETNLMSDPDHCGTCDHSCSIPNGNAICANGACAFGGCHQGFADCNDNPLDGCEVDVDSDPNNCGACNNHCMFDHATAVCTNGNCAIGECDFGFDHCDLEGPVGCETFILGGDVNNCGACGNVCDLPHVTLQLCSAGTCQLLGCESGWGNCDNNRDTGCEHDLSSDDDNCGGCGFTCQGSTHCVGGNCVS